MTAEYISYDDLPWVDERMIHAHAAELIAMAEDLGPANLRYASSNRVVVTLTDHAAPFGDLRFSERAGLLSGHQVLAHSDAVLANPGVSPDLLSATPLERCSDGLGWQIVSLGSGGPPSVSTSGETGEFVYSGSF